MGEKERKRVREEGQEERKRKWKRVRECARERGDKE